MSGFPILDLVIGMIFVFFMLSIISSSGVEIILTGLRARSTLLEKWLFKIFDKKVKQADGTEIPLGQAIMDHCSVTALSGKKESPAYIEAKNFASALLEKITFDPNNPKSVVNNIDDFIKELKKTTILSTEFQRVLLTYANEAKEQYKSVSVRVASEIDIFRSKIENWYDSSMDRLTGALKRKYSRPATFAMGVIVTLFLNADSIAIARYLYSNPEARAKLSEQAISDVKDGSLQQSLNSLQQSKNLTKQDSLTIQQIENNISERVTDLKTARQSLEGAIPLGWNGRVFYDTQGKFSGWIFFSKVVGWLATILAIMMGAPFWFDLLNKISNLRSSGKKPGESGSASTGNAPPAAPVTVMVNSNAGEEAVG